MKKLVLLLVVVSAQLLGVAAVAADVLGGSPPGCC